MRVLIADDQPLFAQALRAALTDLEIDVIGIAGDGAEAVKLTKDLEPDIVMLDLEMPQANGFEVMELLNHKRTPARFVVLTGEGTAAKRRRAAELGAMAFLSKSQSFDHIVATIRLVGAVAGIAVP